MTTAALFQASKDFDHLGGHGVVTSELNGKAPLTRSQTLRLEQQHPTPRHSTSLWRWLAMPALAAGAIVGGVQLWKSHTADAAPVTQQQSIVRVVKVARPTQATTASVVLPATVRPWQATTLVARVSGYLTAWHKDLGATVKAGELLAEIETPELDQEVASAQASAAEANAAAIQAQAERQEAEADLKVAQAQHDRAKADAELAASLLARREKLLANRTISQEEYDTFQKQLEARNAEVAAAQSDVVRRRTNLATRTAIIEAREATAKSRRSNVDRLLELQGFKRIVAPFDGIITQRTAEVGMLVTAGQNSLFAVEDMSRVRVQVNVPQAYSAQTGVGAVAKVSLPESPTGGVDATVTRIAESVEPRSRTMLAEIEIKNDGRRLQPGSYAQVTLSLPQEESAWTIPSNTVQMRVEGPHVALVNDQNQVEIRRVQLGRDLGNRVVVQGIRGDERLVVNPGDDLAQGMRVEVTGGDVATKIAQR